MEHELQPEQDSLDLRKYLRQEPSNPKHIHTFVGTTE
jgi:hypothetical protein